MYHSPDWPGNFNKLIIRKLKSDMMKGERFRPQASGLKRASYHVIFVRDSTLFQFRYL